MIILGALKVVLMHCDLSRESIALPCYPHIYRTLRNDGKYSWILHSFNCIAASLLMRGVASQQPMTFQMQQSSWQFLQFSLSCCPRCCPRCIENQIFLEVFIVPQISFLRKPNDWRGGRLMAEYEPWICLLLKYQDCGEKHMRNTIKCISVTA